MESEEVPRSSTPSTRATPPSAAPPSSTPSTRATPPSPAPPPPSVAMTILQSNLGAVKLILTVVIFIIQVNIIGITTIVPAAVDALKSVLNPVLQYDIKYAGKQVTLVLVLWLCTSVLLSLYLTPVVFISALWQYEPRSAAFVKYLSETEGIIMGTLCCLFTLAEMAMSLGRTSGALWVGGPPQQEAYRPLAPWAFQQVWYGFVRILGSFALIPGGAIVANEAFVPDKAAKVGTHGREQRQRQEAQQRPGQVYGQNATMAGLNQEQLRQAQLAELQTLLQQQYYLRENGGRF